MKGISFIAATAFLVNSLALANPAPVRLQIGGEPSTLDPVHAVDNYGFSILRNVSEGLFKINSAGELEKGLAESEEISADGLVHRYKLIRGACWSDGRAVSVDEFIFALRRALEPKTAAPNADYLFAIKNAHDVYFGKQPPSALGVSREGERLKIELERPDPMLDFELSLPIATPVREDALAANRGQWSYKQPVTGDYRITQYRPTNQIRLEPNACRPADGRLPIVYDILPEEVTAMNLFESGRLDAISTVTATEIERLRAKGLIRTYPSTTVFYFSFNTSKPPFNDPTWRRAVAGVVDREGLVKLLHGAYEATTSFVPRTVEPSIVETPNAFSSSVEKVRAAKAKPRIRLAYGASEFTKIVAEKFQNDLASKLGVQVTLEPSDLKTLLGRLKTDPPEMYFLGMSAVYREPMHHLNSFSARLVPNFSRYQSADFENKLEKIRSTAPGPERTRLVQAADHQLTADDAVVVPMLLRLQVFGVSPKLKNFEVSPYQAIPLSKLR